METDICVATLGIAYRSCGECALALHHHELCILIARETNDMKMMGNALLNLGDTHNSLGDHEMAMTMLQEGLSLGSQTSDRDVQCKAYAFLGHTYFSLREYLQASQMIEKSLYIYQEVDDHIGVASTSLHLGCTYMLRAICATPDSNEGAGFVAQTVRCLTTVADIAETHVNIMLQHLKIQANLELAKLYFWHGNQVSSSRAHCLSRSIVCVYLRARALSVHACAYVHMNECCNCVLT